MAKSKNNKHEITIKSKLKKDPGVPRLPDLKVRVRTQEKQRIQPPPSHHNADPDTTMASEPTLSSLALLASSSSSFSALPSQHIPPAESETPSVQMKEQARRHYIRILHKVVDESDVVVLVLDARDPEGCRSRLVEEEVRRREGEGKKLVFVLNKIDLVPRSNAQAWLRHLRHTTPTLPFRSVTSAQRHHLSSNTAPSLLRLLKAYKPSAQSITVGVVGYPNVGKSSLINSLKRAKVCAVAAQPGHTKDLQSIQLERGIRIVDSPGVVFDEDVDEKGIGSKGSVLLRNVVRVEDVEDPIAVVEEILARTAHEVLQKIYNIPPFTSTIEFLTMLSLITGRLLKGGTPDILTSARRVLIDWNQHKIPYFSVPPAVHSSSIPSTVPSASLVGVSEGGEGGEVRGRVVAPGAEKVGQAQIVSEFSKPFELEGLFGVADAGAFGLGRAGEGERGEDEVMGDGGGGGDGGGDGDGEVWWDAEEGMDEDGVKMDEDDRQYEPLTRKRSHSPSTTAAVEPDHPAKRRRRTMKDEDEGVRHPQLAGRGPLSRSVAKKGRKKARKDARRAKGVGLSGVMEVDDWDGFGEMAAVGTSA